MIRVVIFRFPRFFDFPVHDLPVQSSSPREKRENRSSVIFPPRSAVVARDWKLRRVTIDRSFVKDRLRRFARALCRGDSNNRAPQRYIDSISVQLLAIRQFPVSKRRHSSLFGAVSSGQLFVRSSRRASARPGPRDACLLTPVWPHGGLRAAFLRPKVNFKLSLICFDEISFSFFSWGVFKILESKILLVFQIIVGMSISVLKSQFWKLKWSWFF